MTVKMLMSVLDMDADVQFMGAKNQKDYGQVRVRVWETFLRKLSNNKVVRIQIIDENFIVCYIN